MSIVERFLTEGGGDFATAKNTPVGSTVDIIHVYFDNTTYPDNPAIVINGTRPNGDEIKVRLSRQNVARISKVLGQDEKVWPGNKLKAITHQDYPGLQKTGIIWTGEKGSPLPTQLPSKPVLPSAPLSLDEKMKAWLTENQGIIGKKIPPEVYNLLESDMIQWLVDKQLAYSREDYPWLDGKAREYI